MKVTVANVEKNRYAIQDLPDGVLAADDNGYIYLRKGAAALCLNDLGKSYTTNAPQVSRHYVTLLPPGTAVTLEQEGITQKEEG